MKSPVALFLSCLSALALTGSAAALGQDATPVEFELTPVLEGRAFQAVDVAIRFKGEADGETLLRLSDQWGGHQRLYERLSQIRADGATVSSTENPARRLLKHKPNAAITLRYRIPGAPWSGRWENRGSNDYRPIVTPQFFHLIGSTFVVQPESVDSDAPVRVILPKLPVGMTFASDLEHYRDGKKLLFSDLESSISVGGDFRLIDAGGDARIAIRGDFDKRKPDEWRSVFQRIAETQRQYWRSEGEPFLVTILSYAADGQGYSTGGTGLEDAFVFLAMRNAEPTRLDQTMMHEMIHSWISPKIGGTLLPQQREAEHYWLSEGLTEFVTFRSMVRARLWTPEQFADRVNEAMSGLAASKLRTTGNVAASKLYWTDNDGRMLPYQRGLLFALLIDGQLRTKSNQKQTLDTVLLEMKRRAYLDVTRKHDALYFLRRIMSGWKSPVDGAISKHVDRGKPMVLPATMFAPCGIITDADFAGAQKLVIKADMTPSERQACIRRIGG